MVLLIVIVLKYVCSFFCRFVKQKTPAKTKPTTATGRLSVSTWATSVIPCTNVIVKSAMPGTATSVARTLTSTAGPITTWCVEPTNHTTAKR